MSGNRAVDPSRSINVSSPILILQLNQLLTSLDLPITIYSHEQLTPSLLICILESLLSLRLPISPADRDALFSSTTTKVHCDCMKIFLGVLQADVLQQDVGLSNVDPRRLARGEDTETIFVGRLLCWYGRHKGHIARDPSKKDSRNDTGSPSTLTTGTRRTEMSPVRGEPESNTSVSSGSAHASPHSVPAAPRCIHEVPSPSLVFSPASTRAHPDIASGSGFASLEPWQNTTVRYTGYIQLVDEDAEIAAFEARRAAQHALHQRASPPAPPSLSLANSPKLVG
ncbi:hypothetical protein B0H11DRAFT_660277 [Mycena galericulata]|nr:hypothetical protein B0H11DRAFT_660277 [Mycena galericulata]